MNTRTKSHSRTRKPSAAPSRRPDSPPLPTPGTAEGDEQTVDDDLARQSSGSPQGDLEGEAAEFQREIKGGGGPDPRVLPFGMQETREVDVRDVGKEKDDDTFSPMAIGAPDADPLPGNDNPTGMQTGHGPLNQEGQGNRQDDETAELEEIEPNIDPYQSPR
jgi:hypothetical protein